MKRLSKLLFLPLLGVLLTSCDLLGGLGEPDYSSYEEYFQQEKNYTKYTDMDSLNQVIGETAYFWSMSDSTNYTAYYTSKNVLVMMYKDKTMISIRFTDGNSVVVREKNGTLIFETDEVEIDENGEKNVYITGKESSLDMAIDDEGYLLVAYEKHMFYVTKDLKSVYMNERNTNVFQGYSDTKTIASSALLEKTLENLGEEKRLNLPAPGSDIEIWYGEDYYNNELSHTTAYIAGVSPMEYVEILKENNFTVIRSFEDPFYAFYGENGGYWYCYDEQEDIELLINLTYFLYVNNAGESFGPYQNTVISFYPMTKGYFNEKERTTNEDWDSFDKENMSQWYDGTIDATKIPFIPLSEDYYVPSIKSLARSNALDGTLAYHHECYNITDNSSKYFLDGYDQILEENGYHKYEPNYDLSNPDEKSAFFNTEESKYINCYINEEEDIAIKYYFDVINGNTIRVFKLSEMQSWLVDAE